MPPNRAKRAREEDTHGLTSLHRVRLVPWSVAAVAAIAPCPGGAVVAVGYDDGRVEVWDVEHFCRLVRFPGRDGRQLSAVAWADDPLTGAWRLFAAHLDGSVAELDPATSSETGASDAYGGAVWALAAQPQRRGRLGDAQLLAAACDDGSVRLLAVEAGQAGPVYARSLAQAGGRALSLAWHPVGSILSSGTSDGCIHMWDVTAGRELRRISVGTATAAPPCVWALAALPDGTLVSGDSEGAVQWWEPRFGALAARFTMHAADVLALAAAPDGRVALFQSVADGPGGGQAAQWVYRDAKAPHSHDVRALAVLAPTTAAAATAAAGGGGAGNASADAVVLMSGAADGQLMLYSAPRFLKEHPVRLSKAPQRPMVALAPGGGGAAADAGAPPPPLLLCAAGRQLDVWRLASTAGRAAALHPGAPAEGDALELGTPPRHLARVTTASDGHLAAAALAPGGRRLAASDARRLRLFALEGGGGGGAAPDEGGAPPAVRRVRLPEALPPARALAFSADGAVLFAADPGGRLRAISAEDGAVTAVAPPPPSPSSTGAGGGRLAGAGGASARYLPAVSHLAVSPDGRWLAAARPAGVQLLRLPALQHASWVLGWGEPAPVSALAFSGDGAALAVASGGGQLAVYETATGAPTRWTLDHGAEAAAQLERLPGAVLGLAFNPVAPPRPGAGAGGSKAHGGGAGHRLVVYSAGGLCHVDLMAPVAAPPARARRGPARPTEASAAAACGRNCRLLPLENSCLFFGFGGPDTAVLVEKPWAEVLQQLPPPAYRHRYGD